MIFLQRALAKAINCANKAVSRCPSAHVSIVGNFTGHSQNQIWSKFTSQISVLYSAIEILPRA